MPRRSGDLWRWWLVVDLALACVPRFGHAQDNYEIQVYGAATVPPQTLMIELHSNFTVEGERQTIDGVYPTYHQEHETVRSEEHTSELQSQ